MFLSTSGNSAETSLPSVMAIMVFWMDSFLDQHEIVSSLSAEPRVYTFRMHIGSLLALAK